MNSYRKSLVIPIAMVLVLLLSMSALAQGPVDADAATPVATTDAAPPLPRPPLSHNNRRQQAWTTAGAARSRFTVGLQEFTGP